VPRLPGAEGVADIRLARQWRARELPAATECAWSDHHQLRLLTAEANTIDDREGDSLIEINPNGIHVDLVPSKDAHTLSECYSQR
jgi:hypothetical protein